MRTIRSAIITGPTGAVGTALCRLLSRRGISVCAAVRPGSPRAEHLHEISGVTVVPCDLSDLSSLPALLNDAKADAFFHLAWSKTTGGGRNDMEAQIKNVQYTLDAVRAASALGCPVFIGAGSQAEYGRVERPLTPDTPCFPENGYGMAKLCAGQMSRNLCADLGMDHVWARILSVYGPYDGESALIPTLIRALLQGTSVPLTAGEQIWDYLFSEDAAAALYLLALSGKNGAVYPVGSGEALPLKAYLTRLRDAIDPSLPLRFGELPYGKGQIMHLEADTEAIRRDTGFSPQTDFAAGIRKTIDFIQTGAY